MHRDQISGIGGRCCNSYVIQVYTEMTMNEIEKFN